MKVLEHRPRQKWCDQKEWDSLVESYRRDGKTGDIGYLVDFQIDHHETRQGQKFKYGVAHCTYPEHLATVEYLGRHPKARSQVWEALQRGESLDFARSAPPAAIKINVAVISPEEHFLAIQRSGAVDHKQGLWTVGPNETMRLQPLRIPGAQAEDFFGLAERCLREELDLEPSDYGTVNISWIGFDVISGQSKVYAQARSHLPEREISRRIAQSHGVFEAQSVAWLPTTRRVVLDIMENWETGDSHGRYWSSSAPHALQEMWRFRKYLSLNELG